LLPAGKPLGKYFVGGVKGTLDFGFRMARRTPMGRNPAVTTGPITLSRNPTAPAAPNRAVRDLPGLDSTGKLHGDLPHPKDLGKFDPDDLQALQDDLCKSVQERIRKNSELGPKGNHGLRQGQEQDLIHSIDKVLEGLGQ
jgi:hypothetical protein